MQTLVRNRTSVEVVRYPQWAEMAAREWKEIQSDSVTATVFQTWEWNSIWWKHWGQGKRPVIITIYEGNLPIGIGALYTTNGMWKSLRFIGSGQADYLGILARTGYEEEASKTFLAYIMRYSKSQLFDFHQLPQDSPLLATAKRMPNATTVLQAACSRLELPHSWDAYLGTLGRNMRSSLKRYESAAQNEKGLEIKISLPHEMNADLDTFFTLHGKRWRTKNQLGAMFIPKMKSFHREWAETAVRKGWLRLHTAYLANEPAASVYAYLYNGVTAYYQSGFDPKFAKYSPGTLALSHAIRTAIDDESMIFDFLRGQEGYKSRWKPQSLVRNYRVLIAKRGVHGQCALTVNRWGHKVENKLREHLEGGLGDAKA